MKKFIIRNATFDDIDAIVQFNAAMAFETEQKKLDRTVLRQGVKAIIDDPSLGRYFIADAGEVIGQTLITTEWSDWRNSAFWWIQSVYVSPEWRQQGVFRALYEHIYAIAEKTPLVCGLRLYVEKENHIARQTYQKIGMTITPYAFYVIEFKKQA
ncbi:GNAT family N-acetyltransferase [candidate division KSB1 bacterium]|nr:GNAT family N-acetyltransferase [candidate division KSB1 bacterium]